MGFNGVEFTRDCPEKGNIVKQFEFVVIFLGTLFLHVFTVVFRQSPILMCCVSRLRIWWSGYPDHYIPLQVFVKIRVPPASIQLDHMIWMEVSKNFFETSSDPAWQTVSQTKWACSILGASQPQWQLVPFLIENVNCQAARSWLAEYQRLPDGGDVCDPT